MSACVRACACHPGEEGRSSEACFLRRRPSLIARVAPCAAPFPPCRAALRRSEVKDESASNLGGGVFDEPEMFNSLPCNQGPPQGAGSQDLAPICTAPLSSLADGLALLSAPLSLHPSFSFHPPPLLVVIVISYFLLVPSSAASGH